MATERESGSRAGSTPVRITGVGRTPYLLVDAVTSLSTAKSVPDIVDIVRHSARALVGADGATFVLREGDLCHYVDEDAISPLWSGQRFPMSTCISGWSMQRHESVVIEDVFSDPRIPHDAYRQTFVNSLIMTPVGAVGAVGAYWAGNHRGTEDEVTLLRALADSTAVALESVRVATALARIDHHALQLSTSNRDLAAFAEVAAHDLRAPLTTIRGYAESIQDLDRQQLSTESNFALDALQVQVMRMNDMINTILDFSTAATAAITPEKVPLVPVVERVVSDLRGKIEERGARITVGRLPIVVGSPALIERAIQNLLVNAVSYADPDEPMVWIEPAAAQFARGLSISDNGPGVGAEERESIFDMFSRGSAADRVAGSGIGLGFAHRVVARHGGTLSVDDSPRGGARFTILLPRNRGMNLAS